MAARNIPQDRQDGLQIMQVFGQSSGSKHGAADGAIDIIKQMLRRSRAARRLRGDARAAAGPVVPTRSGPERCSRSIRR
jgi:hypothetical protein